MDLTIVIVNWNGGEMLLRCLESIRASRQSFPVRVIVVDNDSKDGSRARAQEAFPEFRIFNSGGNLGFGRANNLARPLTDTSLVLFLNPDTELKTDTLERAVRCLQDHSAVGALGCKMLYPDGQVQEQGLQWHLTPWRSFLELMFVTGSRPGRRWRWLPTMDPNQSGSACKLYGGFVLARKSVLDQAGWFDERYFMYAEDGDLSRTILSLGWKLYYCSEAEIIHACGGTSAQAPSGFSILMKHESINKLMRKYYGSTGALAYRAAVLTGACLRFLVLLVLWLVGVLRPVRNIGQIQGSFFKHKLMVLWALGLKRAVVPVASTGSSEPPSPASFSAAPNGERHS